MLTEDIKPHSAVAMLVSAEIAHSASALEGDDEQ